MTRPTTPAENLTSGNGTSQVEAVPSDIEFIFPVQLSPTTSVQSVNSTTTKTAPKDAIDQIGHVLPRVIHAFAGGRECKNIHGKSGHQIHR